MQIAAPTDYETIAALDQLKRSVRMAFCGVMQSTRLPPMAAISLAATAVGLLYLEVADAHRGDNSCPCGWEPRGADVEALQTSLALATKHTTRRFPRNSGRRQRVRAASSTRSSQDRHRDPRALGPGGKRSKGAVA